MYLKLGCCCCCFSCFLKDKILLDVGPSSATQLNASCTSEVFFCSKNCGFRVGFRVTMLHVYTSEARLSATKNTRKSCWQYNGGGTRSSGLEQTVERTLPRIPLVLVWKSRLFVNNAGQIDTRHYTFRSQLVNFLH